MKTTVKWQHQCLTSSGGIFIGETTFLAGFTATSRNTLLVGKRTARTHSLPVDANVQTFRHANNYEDAHDEHNDELDDDEDDDDEDTTCSLSTKTSSKH